MRRLYLHAGNKFTFSRIQKKKIALKYKIKQSENGKFTSNYKASPIDFETQISLRR